MKPARALTLSAVVAAVLVTGCSTVVDGRAMDDGKGCLLSPTGLCIRPDDIPTPTTTTTTATPQRNETPQGGVRVCDGDDCDLSDSPDEVSRLVSESLADVDTMWARINIPVSVEMYRGGIGNCDGNEDDAAAWVCLSTKRGGWNPDVLRAHAAKKGATLEDTVRVIMAHEIGHLVVDQYDATSMDFVIDELRADCMAGGYARLTQSGTSSMGALSVETTARVLSGDRRTAAVQAGYDGNPQKCLEYTP